MVKSRLVSLLSLFLAMLLPLMVLGSSGCGRGSSRLENEVWTRQFGTSDSDDSAFAVVADGSGNIYIAGAMDNPSIVPHAFITKYDASGDRIWTKQFGTSGHEYVHATALDGSEGIYVAGDTDGFFPGQTLSGGPDAFVAKYDTAGNEIWTRQFGTLEKDSIHTLVADGLGNIYVAGGTGWSPEASYPGLAIGLLDDIFFAKYDASGNEVWTRHFGSDGPDLADAMVADGSGNIYLAGATHGTFPGQTSSGGIDAFVAKYDDSGNEVWTRQFGTSDFDVVRAMVTDGAGNICVAGGTAGTFPGQTPSGGIDAFIATYDASGSEVWTRQFGNLVNEYAYVMVADESGNIHVANTVDEYPSSASKFLSCGMAHDAEGSHVLVGKYDTSGEEVWAGKYATGHWDTAYAIAADGSGNIYVAGKTGGDAFIMKLRD